MPRSNTQDPLGRLRRSDKREWKQAERRVRNDHDEEQLSALLDLAATGCGVTGLRSGAASEGGDDSLRVAPVEMIIEGRRLRAGRMHLRSLAPLRDALARISSVPLTAVGRYGPYWVLTFKVASQQLVLLADQLTLLPDWGGGPGGRGVPSGPLALAGA